ncbi:unnamed protein product, partial [Natator depressus]
ASTFLSSLDPRECLVLGGDFNTTLEEWDRSGTEQSPADTDVLREIIDHHSLVDIWCDHHLDDESTFTYVRVEEDQSYYSWLDYIYLSHHHLSWAHSSSVRPAPFSVAVMASLTSEMLGQAYWHFHILQQVIVSFVASFQEFWLDLLRPWKLVSATRSMAATKGE